MKKRQVIDNRIEIKVVVLGVARYAEIAHMPTRVRAKHHHQLRLVWMLFNVLHHRTSVQRELSDIVLVQTIGFFDVSNDAIHVWFFIASVDNTDSQAVISVTFRDRLKSIGIWTGVLPFEVLNGPMLQDHDNEQHDNGRKIDQKILIFVRAKDEIILS